MQTAIPTQSEAMFQTFQVRLAKRDGPEIIVEEWAAFEGLNRIRREFQETAIFPLRFHFWFLASCFLLFNS